MSTRAPKASSASLPRNARIAVAAARFNQEFVDELLKGCLERLTELKAPAPSVHHVPGAFELPLAAKWLARTKKYDAIICLGCVIRGDTPHFEYVAGECARGIQRVSLDEGLPVIFGVLTTENDEQVRQRLSGSHGHAGRRAADAAAEMIALRRRITTR
ncbi:MAG TPA: 6,7-dimethyl-8-ribityllumazine synthase [Tepidisphaeraceae bacterium]|nr:6,7-dimethyl-8-ribityllumazine synthase [Tepidisphaeraceae bacterium]